MPTKKKHDSILSIEFRFNMREIVDTSFITQLITPPAGTGRYLRPLVARGPLIKHGAAIVGLNPATAIGPSDIDANEYARLLLSFNDFERFYQSLRKDRGKKPTSPTRTGLNGMAKLLEDKGWKSIVDTNISPYPTEKGEELLRLPASVQSRDVFHTVIRRLAPRLIILHGNEALKEFTSSIAHNLSSNTPFSSLVKDSPILGSIEWGANESCTVLVCPHLRFFGRHGGVKFQHILSAIEQL